MGYTRVVYGYEESVSAGGACSGFPFSRGFFYAKLHKVN